MARSLIICLGTTPALQRVMRFRRLTVNVVNRATFTGETAAGKAVNVAKVLKLLDEEPLAMGVAGGDRGEQVTRFLVERGIKTRFLTVEARTRECTTVIDDSTGTVTELVEESSPVRADVFERLLEDLERELPKCQAVVLSGTLAPGAPADFYAQCVRAAGRAGVLSVVDAQGQALRLALAERPGLAKPNRAELDATLGRALVSEADLRAGCRELLARGAQRVVVTAGKEAVLAVEAGKCWKVQPPRVAAVNPIGSGDAFTAALVWRLLKGEDLGAACRWATAAGAANTLTLMPGELDLGQLEELAAQTKVMSPSPAVRARRKR